MNARNLETTFIGFQKAVEKTPQGYNVLVIHAGTARPITGGVYNFSEALLSSPDVVKLWEGVNCFADHTDPYTGESVRDLAGVFTNPKWDAANKGVTAELRPAGPAAELVHIFAEEMLSDHPSHPDMGFSPVIIFTAKGEDVTSIIRCRSTDMVISPAFENASFLSYFQRNPTMKKKYLHNGAVVEYEEGTQPEGAVLQSDNNAQTLAAMRDLTGASAEIQAQLQASRDMHLAQCAELLDASLNANLTLNDDAKKLIKGRFSGRTFKPQELKDEITSFEAAFAKTTAASVVAGPTQITGMFSSEDQLQAAMDDLLDAPRNAGSENLRVHRFSGIREAYLMLTNDFNFVGDIDSRLAKFQGTTATFPNLVANALNKAIAKHWAQYGKAGYNWWEKIATVEPFETLHDIKWLRLGTIAALEVVGEGEEYPELKMGDNGESSTFYKYGGYLSFTLEAMDKDDTRRLRAAPRELAMAALRNISEQVAAIFTVNSGAGPTLADTGALFNATAVTTAGGHANLLTTALGTDYTAFNAVAKAMYDQPMLVANESGYYGTGKKQAIDPKYVLVPRALRDQAVALFGPRWAQNVEAIPSSGGPSWAGEIEVITVPEWTDTTDWAAAIDPMLVPGVMIGTRYGIMPQVIIAGDQRDPAMFMNDESRLKVRHFLATGIGNWTALHKSNV